MMALIAALTVPLTKFAEGAMLAASVYLAAKSERSRT